MNTPHSFEMLKVDKNDLDDPTTSEQNKYEIERLDKLVNKYSIFDNRHYLTIHMKKNGDFFEGIFWLKEKDFVFENPLYDFIIDFKYRDFDNIRLVKRLRNTKVMKPLKVIIRETIRYIYYELIATTFESAESINIIKNVLPLTCCDICYNDNVEKYEINPFKCCHDSFCVKCVDIIKTTSGKCPLCRSP